MRICYSDMLWDLTHAYKLNTYNPGNKHNQTFSLTRCIYLHMYLPTLTNCSLSRASLNSLSHTHTCCVPPWLPRLFSPFVSHFAAFSGVFNRGYREILWIMWVNVEKDWCMTCIPAVGRWWREVQYCLWASFFLSACSAGNVICHSESEYKVHLGRNILHRKKRSIFQHISRRGDRYLTSIHLEERLKFIYSTEYLKLSSTKSLHQIWYSAPPPPHRQNQYIQLKYNVAMETPS